MKPTISKKTVLADVKAAAEKNGLPVKNGQQVIGMASVKHPGQPAVNYYYLEDNSEIMEDDQGNPVDEWPELPPHVIAKRAAE